MGKRVIDFDDGFTSENAPSTVGLGDLELASTSYLYFGDSDTNGSYRLGFISGVLTMEIRSAGSWVQVETFNNG